MDDFRGLVGLEEKQDKRRTKGMFDVLKALWLRLRHDEKGATMIEYAIMVVLVALAVLLLTPDLRSLVVQIFSTVASGMGSGLTAAS
jgi:Flp pilus assembly pilin Flp